jgi:hypothetical protein
MPRLYQTSPRLTFVVLAAAAAAFSLMAVVTVVGLAARRLVPPSPVRTAGRVNWLAALLLSGWLVALLLPLSKAPVWGWGSARTLGLFALAVVLIAAWLAYELRSVNPLIDMRMMRLPAVRTTNLAAMLFGAAMFAVYAFLPRLMQTPSSAGYGFGAGVTTSGLLMLPILVGMALSGSASGVASGMNANIRTIGASIGAAVVASIVTAHIQPSGYPAESGYTTSFVLLAIISLAATAVALLVPAARKEPVVRPVESLEELSPVEV